MLLIAAEIYVTGALIYTILGTGKMQPWAIEHRNCDVITTSSGNNDALEDDMRTMEEKAPLIVKSPTIQ